MESDKSRPTYTVNEIFYSLQGEGVRAGTANLFLRLSGCNQTCLIETHGFSCDTEFVSGIKMTAEDIVSRCRELSKDCNWIIVTGGEPLLQLDLHLAKTLKDAGFSIAIETNGSINPSAEVLALIDWIACSPKVAEHAVKLERCDELKYVRGYGQGIPKPKLSDAIHKLISPAFEGPVLDPRTLKWCIDLVKDNPTWRLSVQQHKGWSVR
jgi:organic radical activating enzyme